MDRVYSVTLAIHAQALTFTGLHLTTGSVHLLKMDEMMAMVLIINYSIMKIM